MRLEEHPFGISWTTRQVVGRTSHALAEHGRVWIVDPVDVPEALARTTALGTPVAVVQLLDRHNRDCAAIAARLGVPHLRVPDEVPDSPFEVVRVLRTPPWRESALWWPDRRVLVVAETVGTGRAFRVGTGPAGIHPLLRATPPGALRDFEPEHLLVGHGRSLHGEEAASGLHHAYARSRRDVPRMVATIGAMLLRR